jgi:hypothetical protein
MLFAAPGVIMLVAAGVDQVREATRAQAVPIGGILLALVLLQPLFISAEYALRPVQAEEF